MRFAATIFAVLALSLSMRGAVGQSSTICTDKVNGCPESGLPVATGFCQGVTPLTSVNDPNNCARYVFCLKNATGFAFRCPAGYVPGTRCVADTTTPACVPPCADTVNGCVVTVPAANITYCANVGTNIASFADPVNCGIYTMCVGTTNAFTFQCPPGYRGNGDPVTPHCTADYSCPTWNTTRTALCTNYTYGCGIGNDIVSLPICQNYTLGVFDSPSQCGIYMFCLSTSQGFLFQCPQGYSTDVFGTNRCVVDPDCPTPVTPRQATPTTGCLNVNVGCVGSNTAVFPPCAGKASFTTNIDDPVRCGYYQKCTNTPGGPQAVSYYCPVGYRADVTKTQICQQDAACIVPETSRYSVLLQAAGLQQAAAATGGAVTSSPCSNTAYGCPVSRTQQSVTQQTFSECANKASWVMVQSLTDCSSYIICSTNLQGVQIQCPAGYRAVASSIPHCLLDATCTARSAAVG